MTKRRVYITGMGLVSPLGLNVETSWRALCAGESAAAEITSFDASAWPVNYACEVQNFPVANLDQAARNYLNRPGQFAVEASKEAFAMAGLSKAPQSSRAGVMFGTGIGVIRPVEIVALCEHFKTEPGLPGILAHLETHQEHMGTLQLKNHPRTLLSYLAETYNLGGPSLSLSTACAAGAQALGYGYRAIQDASSDLMLVGGADSLAGELLFAGFCMLGVMSAGHDDPKKAAKPFDKLRSGFVAGEGAAAFVLESEESMLARGATPICELIGYGESENAYRITDLPEDGAGAQKAMQDAVGSHAARVNLINAHGTATIQNDKVESYAIERVFYDAGFTPAITANKAQIGHFVAAAGAVEAVFSIKSIREQIIPPIINFNASDCSEKLNYISGTAQTAKIDAVLSNSFGFGGTNASLLFAEA